VASGVTPMSARSRIAAWVAIAVTTAAAPHHASPQQPASIAYSLRLDANHLDVAEVSIRIAGAPSAFHLAMKVHPEYDAKYSRFIDSIRVTGTSDDRAARVTRADSTLWDVQLPGGRGTIRYRVHIQPSPPVRRAWQAFARPTGALINPPDFFLYIAELAATPVTVDLSLPHGWRVATALASRGASGRYSASDAAALLDAPILLGALHEWSFRDRGTTWHVAYWPLPDAAPFDTVAFVSELRRLTGSTVDVFRRAPARDFYFLLQDGADDALEHRSSVTIGVPSAALASDPRAPLTEIAHEFFHSWNLVAIHPDDYGTLSYRPPRPNAGLWWGEGVTMYYASALPRRAALTAAGDSRLDHLKRIVNAYYGQAWLGVVSPERASLAFGESPVANPDATGGYYMQGELVGYELDALVRDSTHDAHGLDDVMRALYARSATGRGFTTADLEAVSDSVCGCRLEAMFTRQVRGAEPIDVRPALERLGLRLVVDTALVTNDSGVPLPDARASLDFSTADHPPLTLVLANPASAWRRAGLRTGDRLITLNGASVPTAVEFLRVTRSLRLGDTAVVAIERAGAPLVVRVPIATYTAPRARIVDAPSVSATQRARREKWLSGW
jgi:predicted metalloprotease with PDZ domain